MPTILVMQGWRLFFYSNEGAEPIHVHARKAETECKYWLYPATFEIEEAWAYELSPPLRREIRKIIFDHFELICDEWQRVFGDFNRESN
jgi:Domain of unknown function (DUF4160)